MRRWLAGLAVAAMIACVAQAGEARVDAKVTAQVTARFKRVREATGILGVNRDVQACYDSAARRIDATRLCMLYDIAQVRLDRVVAGMFRSMGQDDPSIDNEFLSERAFELRMKIYAGVAFGGSEAEAFRFFGDAPDRIVQSR